MKRLSPFVTVVIAFAALTLVGLILAPFAPLIEEAFGAQGGEMVQLAASHVPTAEDARAWKREQQQVQRDLINLTGSY
jgi:hypothetical protein